MSRKRVLLALWGGYSLVTLYWVARLWGRFPAFADTLEYVYPEKWFNVESFRQGRIPLWNPYIACGTPHVANWQSAFFYPFFWVWNGTGLAAGFSAVALSHGLLAAAGFYLWIRSQKVSEIPASLAAISFGGSALLVNYWGFPTHLAAVAWVPWIFWASGWFFREPSLLTGSAVSLFWAFQILAGYPLFTFYAALFLAFFIRWNQAPPWKRWGGYFAAGGFSLLLTACQWLPFADFLGYFHREGWNENIFSLRWINFLTLLQPGLLGVPGTPGYRGDYPNFIFNNIYLGLVPLAWILGTLLFFRKFRESFWKVSALFWLLWMAGVHFGPWRILPERWLEVLEPSKASFLFLFCALTSVGLSLEEKFRAAPARKGLSKWGWILGGIWFLDALLVPTRLIHPVDNPYLDPSVTQSALAVKNLAGAGRILSLREEGAPASPGARDFNGFFREKALSLAPNTNVVQGVRSAGGYLSTTVDGYQNLLKYIRAGFPYDGRVLDAAGASLFVIPRPLTAFKYRTAGRTGPFLLETNAGAMGRMWAGDKVREFPDRARVFEAMLAPKAFLENELYVEKVPGEREERLEPCSRTLPGLMPGNGFPSVSPSSQEFEADLPANGFFAFNETFAPGWRAWVDGKPQPILRAYGLFMAVRASAGGTHRISFRYEPASFRLGLFLTLAAGAFLGAGLWVKRRELAGEVMRLLLKI